MGARPSTQTPLLQSSHARVTTLAKSPQKNTCRYRLRSDAKKGTAALRRCNPQCSLLLQVRCTFVAISDSSRVPHVLLHCTPTKTTWRKRCATKQLHHSSLPRIWPEGHIQMTRDCPLSSEHLFFAQTAAPHPRAAAERLENIPSLPSCCCAPQSGCWTTSERPFVAKLLLRTPNLLLVWPSRVLWVLVLVSALAWVKAAHRGWPIRVAGLLRVFAI